MQKLIYTICLYLFSIGLYSQTNYSFDIETGLGFNGKTNIAGKKASNTTAFIGALHTTIKRNNSNRFLLETSIYAMYLKNHAAISNVDFTIKKTKLGVDLVTGYNFLEKTQFLFGPAISTVPALEKINFYKPQNLKFELLLKINHVISSKFSTSLRLRTTVNQLGDDVFIEDPKHSISLGINYHLRKI